MTARCYRCSAPATRRTKVCACGSRAFIAGHRPQWPPTWVVPTASEFNQAEKTVASIAFVLGSIPHHEPDLLALAEPHYHGRRRSRRAAA